MITPEDLFAAIEEADAEQHPQLAWIGEASDLSDVVLDGSFNLVRLAEILNAKCANQ